MNPAFFIGIIIFSATIEAIALGRVRTADYTPGDLGFDPLRSAAFHSLSPARPTSPHSCCCRSYPILLSLLSCLLASSDPPLGTRADPFGRLYTGKSEAVKRDFELKELNNGRSEFCCPESV